MRCTGRINELEGRLQINDPASAQHPYKAQIVNDNTARTTMNQPTTHPHAPDLLSWGLRRFGILRRSASCAVAASTMKVRRSASAAFSSGGGATSIAGATGTMGTTAGGSSCHSAGGATGTGGSGRRCASDATTGGGAAAAGGGGPVGVVTWTASAPSSPPRGVTIDGATRSAGALEQRPIDDSLRPLS